MGDGGGELSAGVAVDGDTPAAQSEEVVELGDEVLGVVAGTETNVTGPGVDAAKHDGVTFSGHSPPHLVSCQHGSDKIKTDICPGLDWNFKDLRGKGVHSLLGGLGSDSLAVVAVFQYLDGESPSAEHQVALPDGSEDSVLGSKAMILLVALHDEEVGEPGLAGEDFQALIV